MATEGSSAHDHLRIVLLGKTEAGKSSLANRLLSIKAENRRGGEHVGQKLMRREGENAGWKLTVVDTPGWDRVSVKRTPAHIQKDIIRSPTLCLPGPHALLLVLSISTSGNPPSRSEIKSATHHVALLSTRAWRYTMVVFVCQDEVDETVIDQYLQKAEKLIDKCGGRYFILHKDTEVSSLLQSIDCINATDIVDENCGDFLIPQIYYEVFEKRTVEQLEMYKRREQELKQLRQKQEKMEAKLQRLKASPRKRESIDMPPNLSDLSKFHHQESITQKVDLQPMTQGYDEEFVTVPRYYLRVLGVIMAAVIGGFLGSIVGAGKEALGSCIGMVSGFLIGLIVGVLIIGVTRLVKGDTILTLVFGGMEQNPEVKTVQATMHFYSPKRKKKVKKQ